MTAFSSGPTGQERVLLDLVVNQLATEGTVLGGWQHEPAPLTVDFVFEEAKPEPLAVEVTSLVYPDELAGRAAVDRHLTTPLTELAQEEGWGRWLMTVAEGAHYKEVAPFVTDLIRDGVEITRDGNRRDHLKARRHGILSLVRSPDGRGDDAVIVIPWSGIRPVSGFTEALRAAVWDKVDQLSAAKPRRTHLVIDVHRWDYAREAADTAPPALPEAIDRIWVLHRWAEKRDLPNLWWADRDATQWSHALVNIASEPSPPGVWL